VIGAKENAQPDGEIRVRPRDSTGRRAIPWIRLAKVETITSLRESGKGRGQEERGTDKKGNKGCERGSSNPAAGGYKYFLLELTRSDGGKKKGYLLLAKRRKGFDFAALVTITEQSFREKNRHEKPVSEGC